MDDDIEFITERPTFEDLYNIRRQTCQLNRLISALASEEDVVQRATDLYYAAEAFLKSVKKTLVVDNEGYDNDF